MRLEIVLFAVVALLVIGLLLGAGILLERRSEVLPVLPLKGSPVGASPGECEHGVWDPSRDRCVRLGP